MAVLALVAICVVVDIAGRRLVGSSNLGDPISGVTEVAVRDNEFAPAAIDIPVGATVTWRWAGDNRHNVAGDGFESPVQVDGGFVHTFVAAGTYDYRCTLHPRMDGRVVVTAESPS